MPYFCTRVECGYVWDARGRTRKKVRCPKCRSRKTLYRRHIEIADIENFIKRRKRYLKEHLPEKKPKPKPKKEPKVAGRLRKQLTSGHIEYFHKRYRQYKERHPYEEPRHLMAREWLMSSGIGRHLADRWAMELLEKHKPDD